MLYTVVAGGGLGSEGSFGVAAASMFGAPGRGSDAPTWRKDIPAPVLPSASAGSSSSGSGTAAAGAGPGDGAAPPAGRTSKTGSGDGGAWDGGAAAGSNAAPDAAAGDENAASYHSSNAAALNAALAPDQDFEYGDDFKRQRQAQAAAAQGGRGPAGPGGWPCSCCLGCVCAFHLLFP